MKFRQTKEHYSVNFPNSSVIFNSKTYRSFVLNDTASLVWNFCKKPRDLNQVSRFLNSEFQIGLSKALKDTVRLVRQLEKRKLLVSSELS